MNTRFLPELKTAELAFRQSQFGAQAIVPSHLPGHGVVLAPQARRSARVCRLDATARMRRPDAPVNYAAVRENIRSRLLGIMASLAWRSGSDHATVLMNPHGQPEFTPPLRAALVEQLDIAAPFVDAQDNCQTFQELAADFRKWVLDNRDDGGLHFEILPHTVEAYVPATAVISR